ncbi:sugar transferase [Ruminococcus sp.]|uniref:sugar transferase n=1 Tax=Ruminococcus sp. TaxID=41978 RepID=UPI002600E292|nr:sugar transferase [Ruminococcus sp.]MBR1431789.1 sugar transferase [Ruminococcus sp.]
MSEKIPKVKKTLYTTVFKRFFDIALSGIAILFLSPLFIVISLLELVFHGYPILFSQERPGLHGEIFKLWKFRSMTNAKDKTGKLLPSEQRLTPFGKFIRRFSLDELPELFCILTGKMSIIGPRPLLKQYLPLYSKRHRMRHEVRPGFACVPLKPMKTWSWNDQFENDIWYVENCSLIVDIKMIFAVLREAIAGSEYRANDTRTEFTGDNLYSDAKNINQ